MSVKIPFCEQPALQFSPRRSTGAGQAAVCTREEWMLKSKAQMPVFACPLLFIRALAFWPFAAYPAQS
eukprot:1792033-Amphidinium_carterae.1